MAQCFSKSIGLTAFDGLVDILAGNFRATSMVARVTNVATIVLEPCTDPDKHALGIANGLPEWLLSFIAPADAARAPNFSCLCDAGHAIDGR